jgi:hypothetical protein
MVRAMRTFVSPKRGGAPISQLGEEGGGRLEYEHFCPSTVYLQYNLALLLFANITPMPIRHKLAADVTQCSTPMASSKLVPV